jgi:ABC-type transport system substrate-binding protein
MTYTFNLRQGVKFSNGDPFNAYQAWFQYYMGPYMYENYTGFFPSYPGIFNMAPYDFGPATVSMINQSGLANPSASALAYMSNKSIPIYVTGQYTLVFHMDKPFQYLLGVLDGEEGMIYDAQYVLNHGGPPVYGTPAMSFYTSNAVPGTGPYTIAQYVQNAHITFDQNPTYWGANLTPAQVAANPLLDPGHVKQVVIYYKADDLARYTDLSKGAVQIATIESQDWNLITSNPSTYGWVTFPPWANIVSFLAFNVNEYPTNITDVRLAIEHSINYTQLDQAVFGGQISPYVGPETPGFGALYDPGNYPQYSFNVTLAQQLLKEANIANFPAITLSLVSGYTVLTNIATILQAQLAQNLGITLNINSYSYSEYMNYYNSEDIVLSPNLVGNIAFNGIPSYGQIQNTPVDDWAEFATCASAQSCLNEFSGWQSNSTAALVAAISGGSSNQTYITQIAKQAQQSVYDQAPFIWIGIFKLVVGDGSVAYDKSLVNGFCYDPMWSGADVPPIFNTVTFAGQTATCQAP